MGTDAANSLDQWKMPTELLALVTPIIVSRAGEGEINWTLLERLGGKRRRSKSTESSSDFGSDRVIQW